MLHSNHLKDYWLKKLICNKLNMIIPVVKIALGKTVKVYD